MLKVRYYVIGLNYNKTICFLLIAGTQATVPLSPIKALPFTAHKRPRLELDEDEYTDISESIAEPHDSTDNPGDSAVTEESGLWLVLDLFIVCSIL